MKRTATERRISMKKEKNIRAKKAQECKNHRRDNVRLGRYLINADFYYGFCIEDSHTAAECRKFYKKQENKKSRRISSKEMKSQLLEKFFLEEEKRKLFEEQLEEAMA